MCVGAILGSAQGLHLALCFKITSGKLRRPYRIPELEFRSATLKASGILPVPSLGHPKIIKFCLLITDLECN